MYVYYIHTLNFKSSPLTTQKKLIAPWGVYSHIIHTSKYKLVNTHLLPYPLLPPPPPPPPLPSPPCRAFPGIKSEDIGAEDSNISVDFVEALQDNLCRVANVVHQQRRYHIACVCVCVVRERERVCVCVRVYLYIYIERERESHKPFTKSADIIYSL